MFPARGKWNREPELKVGQVADLPHLPFSFC
jgi:hypothetical protein